eukprot:m.360163 g.360163  ORF g.360163 m.360163 type:complete len:408 (+) comp18908_c0_seq1:170-1393(+)
MSSKWNIRASKVAMDTTNPIRDLVDNMDLTGNPELPMIPLSIGDPTVFGNMQTPAVADEAVIEAVQSHAKSGYAHSTGYEDTRQAIAEDENTRGTAYTASDVVITSGCSGALQLMMTVLQQPGCNIAVPEPGFSLYKTLGHAYGIEMRGYPLLAETGWQADLAKLDAVIDENTVAILINNPSNPCGSVFSTETLQGIIDIAERHAVPIISDEVYATMTFTGHEFVPAAALATKVPVLTCGGLAKRFLVPGWRLGWILIHDPVDAFKAEVRTGLLKLSQHILGGNTLVQAAVPRILKETQPEFLKGVLSHLESNAVLINTRLEKIDGLVPIMPHGAMYFMVKVETEKFKDIENDRDFTQMLLKEQSVFCLPAAVFDAPDFFRVVTTIPQEKMSVALDRMEAFVAAHHV